MSSKKQQIQNRYYRTTNFHLAAFLFAKGCSLVNIDKLESTKRATFVILNGPSIDDLVRVYSYAKENDADVMVDARKLLYAIKELKEKLYQDRF